jgi:hypothetical protein
MTGDCMGSFAHSPGFQDWDLKDDRIDPKALAEIEAEIRQQPYDLQAEMDRAERRVEICRKLLWANRCCENFILSTGPSYAIKPHLENMVALLDELEALENGAPL